MAKNTHRRSPSVGAASLNKILCSGSRPSERMSLSAENQAYEHSTKGSTSDLE